MEYTDILAPNRDNTVSEGSHEEAREAFETLVSKHREQVYRVAIQMMRRHEDADDVVQETFLCAYRSLGRFRGAASVETWIYRIVTNVALNHLRQRERTRRFLRLFGVQPTRIRVATPSAALEADETRRAVHDAIATLSPPQRAVVVLSDLEGLNSGEVAEVLGIPEGTVRSRLHHARKHLRKCLASYVLDREGNGGCI